MSKSNTCEVLERSARRVCGAGATSIVTGTCSCRHQLELDVCAEHRKQLRSGVEMDCFQCLKGEGNGDSHACRLVVR